MTAPPALLTKPQVSSAVEQRREVLAQLASDNLFGPVLLVLRGEKPDKNLQVAEVRAWRRAEARSKLSQLVDG